MVPPVPPVQPPAHHAQPAAPPAQQVVLPVQPGPMPQLNWSHFKPELAGKPDQDAEAHLLRTNDWMDTNAFPEGVKIQRSCLTLAGEARFWYESLRPIALDWNGLQNQIIQQYSKIGNTRKHLFYVWRSFHSDENTEMLDAYVMCIRQEAALLGYGKPQVLEVFKNTLPMRLYRVLFSYRRFKISSRNNQENTYERKIDRQLAGQSSSTPFMNIRDGYNSKEVVMLDMQDRLYDKLDKITSMIRQLRGSNQNRLFKPKIYQGKRRGQTRNYFD